MNSVRHYGLLVLLFLSLAILVSGCHSNRMEEYYSQRDNYISASGIITHISNNEEKQILYIEFQNLKPEFDDTCFKIAGDSYDIVMENGIEQVLQIGVYAEFVSAPRYFGDGYVMPIASVEIDGKTYLDFEDGFANLVKMYSS